MSPVRLQRSESGGFRLENWPVWAARLLDHLVVLADPDPAEQVKIRLYQPIGDDEKRRAEWARNVHPELFALVASARTIVLSDLARAQRGDRGTLKRLEIPAEHIPAWISALNVARLHLSTLHNVDAGAMRAPPHELTDDVRGPVGLIDFYGWVQGFLVEGRLAAIGEPPPAAGAAGGAAVEDGAAPREPAPDTAQPEAKPPKRTRKTPKTEPEPGAAKPTAKRPRPGPPPASDTGPDATPRRADPPPGGPAT